MEAAMSYATTSETGPEPDDVSHGHGIMGSQPSQAIFLGNMALVLLALAVLTPVVVVIAVSFYA
jgi:hypothetical protein